VNIKKTTIRGTAPSGSIGRAILLIRLLARSGTRGLALTDLARATGLPHGTVHRVLRKLIGERMAWQKAATRRYTLGALAFELGLAASAQFDIRPIFQPVLVRLAERVDDTVYLIGRSGFEAVCLDRLEGKAPIRVLEIDIGSRRPLGLGAGGLAILSVLSDEEITEVLGRVALDPGFLPNRVADVWAAVADARKRGHAFVHDRVTRGVSAVGVAVLNSLGTPVASITVAAIHERMKPARIKSLALELKRASSEVEDQLVRAPAMDRS
jgi:DNA-binding IclR family transcriptional regulator